MIFIWKNEQSDLNWIKVFFEYYKVDNNKLSNLKKTIQSKLKQDEIVERLYNYKGYEIEEEDICFINNLETIYISTNSKE